ncbi:hypothetical protein A3H81_01710 [Candidatus Daviesbacteria bacterium RIFCSPLOWO2_02_FULL_38_18]|nr:MAG: hypothetical protein A3H81_01710 [Candidatus Daviesbacteria bacterium RIFCSPLOWO2_02_FULL_38_18]OGE73358.1 MAG: hypothetical protein A3H18_04850 [Candidatus Daviesbacteria bacterium RIFCSPLOWO2_12_FULL_38_10]HCB22854.1 hypothetical protein [Candidatus Daviesbacteria bacterium]
MPFGNSSFGTFLKCLIITAIQISAISATVMPGGPLRKWANKLIKKMYIAIPMIEPVGIKICALLCAVARRAMVIPDQKRIMKKIKTFINMNTCKLR